MWEAPPLAVALSDAAASLIMIINHNHDYSRKVALRINIGAFRMSAAKWTRSGFALRDGRTQDYASQVGALRIIVPKWEHLGLRVQSGNTQD